MKKLVRRILKRIIQVHVISFMDNGIKKEYWTMHILRFQIFSNIVTVHESEPVDELSEYLGILR